MNFERTLLNLPSIPSSFQPTSMDLYEELKSLCRNSPFEKSLNEAFKFTPANFNLLFACRDENGNSLIHHISTFKAPELIKKLIDLGANPNELNREGKTPFHFALEKKHQENLQIFLSSSSFNISQKFSDKNYAEYAFENSFFEAIIPLLSHGLDPNKCSVSIKKPQNLINFRCKEFPPLTLLQAAVILNNRPLVESLIDHGSHLNAGNDHFLIPKKNEIRTNVNLQQRLLYSSFTPLQLAICMGNIELIKLLKLKGAESQQPLPHSSNSLKFYKNIPEKFTHRDFYPILHYIDNQKLILKTEIKEKIKSLLASRQNKATYDNIFLHKELSHVWSTGHGRTFEIGRYVDDYDGYWHNPSSKIIIDNLKKFLNENSSNSFFTPEILNHFTYITKSLLSNGNIVDKSSKELLKDIESGEPVIIHTGWKGHSANLLFYKNFLLKINNGEGNYSEDTIKCYHYSKPPTEAFLNEVRFRENKTESFFNFQMDKELNLTLVEELCLKKKSQSVGNCTLSSKKLAIYAVLFLMAKDHPLEYIKQEPEKHAKELYHSFSYGMRLHSLQKIKRQIEKVPSSFDWSGLSEAYIKSQKTPKTSMQSEKLGQIKALFSNINNNISLHRQLSENYNYCHYLIATGRDKLISNQLLTKNNNLIGNEKNLLHTAIESKNKEALVRLLTLGADPNKQNILKETPLMVAFKSGFKEGIETLLETNKIDLTLKDSDNLLYAPKIFYDNKEELLLELPKHLIQNQFPFYIGSALLYERYEFLEKFIEVFNLNVNDPLLKKTFLQEAFCKDDPKIFEFLEKHHFSFSEIPNLLGECLNKEKVQLADFLMKKNNLINKRVRRLRS